MERAAPPMLGRISNPACRSRAPLLSNVHLPSGAQRPASNASFIVPVIFWLVLIFGLLAWHAHMTLQLFGAGEPWQNLTDDRPIVSGRHPLHLYHGFLGARSFLATHFLSCYDPAFQTGYPKTPVFDSGSRPAELFLTMAGGIYDPAAYKIGVAICCLLVPLFVLVACWGAGLSLPSAFLATGASLLVWWSTPGWRAVEAGDIDLLLAALAILAHVGLLIRFDTHPGFLTWQGMLFTACLGWFAHPMLFLMVLPLVLVYYLSTGVRHGLTTWHMALVLSELGALALNSFWLVDWLRHWWLRSPLPSGDAMLLHRTIATIWTAPQWGAHPDRIWNAILLISALLGVVVLNQAHARVAARLLGMGAGGLWLLAILGISWEPLGLIGTAQLMVPALWFAALPAAHAWTQAYRLVAWLAGSPLRGVLVVCMLLGGLAYAGRDLLESWSLRCTQTRQFALGLSADRQGLVQTLKETTTPDARILWEDSRTNDETQRWTALLPLLTSRFFIGGLDPNETIPHSRVGLNGQALCGRPLSLWSAAELDGYCKRYNVGWIVCRSQETATYFRAWPGARETTQLGDEGPVYLFTVVAAPHTYVLKGKATVLHMDSHHITLADLEPEDGVVVLSLHFQKGMQAAPEVVTVVPEPDAQGRDLIPFVLLRLDRKVTRVTLTWVGR